MSRARTARWPLLLLGLLLSGRAHAGGFILYEQGAAAMAQSSAVVARPDDASAVFYNPAGLAWQEGTSAMAGGTFIIPVFSHELEGVTTDAERQVFYTPNLYLSHRLNEQFSLGLGGFSLFGLGVKWPDQWIGREVVISSELVTYYINPCVVWRPLSWLALGAGFDLAFASLDSYRQLDSGLEYWDVRLGGATIGYGGNAGVLARPLDWLSVGVTFRSGLSLDASGRVDFDVHPTFQQDLPDQGLTASVSLPHVIAIGIAGEPLANLTIEADLELILWSSFDELVFEFDNGTREVAEQDWTDGFLIRVGAEYRLDQPALAFRLGYAFDYSAVPDRTLTPELPDANQHNVSVGVGYTFYGVTLDAGYMFVLLSERTVTAENNIYLPGTYNGTAHLAATHLSYRF